MPTINLKGMKTELFEKDILLNSDYTSDDLKGMTRGEKQILWMEIALTGGARKPSGAQKPIAGHFPPKD